MLVAFSEGRIFGAVHGEGDPTVLALHGWQRSSADFDRVLGARPDLDGDPFAGRAVASIALDLPGFGASAPPPGPWGTEAYADAVAAVLAELPRPVTVLGHSFGGRVAIRLAVRAPELVSALVLTGVPIRPQGAGARPSLAYRAWRFGRAHGLVSEARLEAARRRYGSRDYREAEGVLRQVLVASVADDYLPLLARIEQPVTLVWGSLDTAAPLEGARLAEESLLEGRLLVLEGVGHLVPTEAPDALRRALVVRP